MWLLKRSPTKKVFVLIVILLSSMWMVNFQTIHGTTTLLVPQDYPSINQAINHASSGDAVRVGAGIYYENLQIYKPIWLMGEDQKYTVIVGEGGVDRGANPVVAITADNVKVSGFTIQSSNYSSASYYATGINIQGDNCTITGNTIENTYIGIFCSIQSNTKIAGNTITGSLKDGMRIYGGSQNEISDNKIFGNKASGIAIAGYSNTIARNTFEGNLRGIGLGSTYSVVYGNLMSKNTESGIFLAGSENIISANNISGNKWGIYITAQLAASHANQIYHNNFQNNAFNAYDNSPVVENWDKGPLGGNFWSDYTSKYPNASENGNSGIGNTAYVIWADNIDNYPLMKPFSADLTDVPSPILPATASPNSVVASWPFDSVDSGGVSPDMTGQNPAVLGSTNGNKSFVPALVEGKFGKALSFNGEYYVNVRAAPSLETPNEFTVDVWVNAQSFKADVAYNNMLVECVRTLSAVPDRTLGVALNGETPQNDSSPAVGALRAYVLTKEGFNEIATKVPVPLNQWIHVVFTRSLKSGMHLYVDGQEKEVAVTAGSANPQGLVMRQNEIYIGHDAICTVDMLQITNTAEPISQPLWTQWWLWTIVFASMVGSGLTLYGKRVRRRVM